MLYSTLHSEEAKAALVDLATEFTASSFTLTPDLLERITAAAQDATGSSEFTSILDELPALAWVLSARALHAAPPALAAQAEECYDAALRPLLSSTHRPLVFADVLTLLSARPWMPIPWALLPHALRQDLLAHSSTPTTPFHEAVLLSWARFNKDAPEETLRLTAPSTPLLPTPTPLVSVDLYLDASNWNEGFEDSWDPRDTVLLPLPAARALVTWVQTHHSSTIGGKDPFRTETRPYPAAFAHTFEGAKTSFSLAITAWEAL